MSSAGQGRPHLHGTANAGEIAAMSQGFAADGTFTSPALDAGQISSFGKIQLRGTLPGGTSLKVPAAAATSPIPTIRAGRRSTRTHHGIHRRRRSPPVSAEFHQRSGSHHAGS